MAYRIAFFAAVIFCSLFSSAQPRQVIPFNKDWKFFLGDDTAAKQPAYNDASWRTLNLPHDWSIEGSFNESHPATFNQGALPTGIGWYRKTFTLPQRAKGKNIYINFDGVYRNSKVWINGHYLGLRPNGYSSFRYDLTPHLKAGSNTIAVRVDNSAQPSSRWYTGSGIYRKVWLEATNAIAVNHWGSFVTTPQVSKNEAVVTLQTEVLNTASRQAAVDLVYELYDEQNRLVATHSLSRNNPLNAGTTQHSASLKMAAPQLWSLERPYLYKAVTKIFHKGKLLDRYETSFGIRSFFFDAERGFFLDGKALKIFGVCNHHDLGALGAAVNKRAIERQLELLKAMGCNAIRTAHNPPAQELLDLCDRMGFLVMDEAFDMWRKRKNKFDYHVEFADWYRQDLEAMVKRDRNHPSVFVWSIGNEIREQFDSTGLAITKALAGVVKNLDPSRPVTSALTENEPAKNFIYQSGALDVLGFNYKHADYPLLPARFPEQAFMATETASALSTRGHYEFPSDSNRVWPPDAKSKTHGNKDHTASAYDNTFAYWGATHEESWKAVKRYPFMAGLFVWAGFDFLGEPVPYGWPSRSSYYGILDLAGFPKDVYYMYQSEWSAKPVLHIFPHWNWRQGDSVDVWAYYNNADEVELFLNGQSLGKRRKKGEDIHVMWRVKYRPGTLRAVSRKRGKVVLQKEIKTAGEPALLQLTADRKRIKAAGDDLSFVTVKLTDAAGNLIPDADGLVEFSVSGPAFISGVDNGDPVSMESFKASSRKTFHGLCLAILQTTGKKGTILLKAEVEGLPAAIIRLQAE